MEEEINILEKNSEEQIEEDEEFNFKEKLEEYNKNINDS